LIEKYGIESFEAHKQELFNSTEQMMKQEIRGIPKGVYEGESRVYYDGKHPNSEFPIHVKITVEDDSILFDFSKTSPQTNGFVNGTYASTCSAITLSFLQMVNPNIPHNEGMIKPLKYIVPEGTILNASYPKATTFGNHLCPQVADSIFKALSPAIPERVTAGWNHLLCSLFTGIHPRTNRKYVDICFLGMKGGSGALEGDDGYDHIGMIDASGGVLDQDYEMYEQQTPHFILKHEYLTDSAGAGKWRGGLGVETKIKLGGEGTKMVVFGDGHEVPPYGLFGGKESILNKISLLYPDGKEKVPLSKDIVNDIPDGTVYYQIAGGGGGYGNPKERDIAKVASDVRNEICSVKNAKENYGIVFKSDSYEVDEENTAKLRSR
jgi:N-methylhydantoinase B